MATFVFQSVADKYPVGTTVKAYPRANFPAVPLVPTGAPVGSEDDSAVVQTNGTLTFTAVDEAVYVAYASVGGRDVYITFTPGEGIITAPDFAGLSDGDFPQWDGAKFIGVPEAFLDVTWPKYGLVLNDASKAAANVAAIDAVNADSQASGLPVLFPSTGLAYIDGSAASGGYAITLPHNVNWISPGPAPYDEPRSLASDPTHADYTGRFVLYLADASNVGMIQGDRTGPIRPGQDGAHRWQRSALLGITLHGNRFNQTSPLLHNLYFDRMWGVYFDVYTLQATGDGAFLDDCNEVNGWIRGQGFGRNFVRSSSGADSVLNLMGGSARDCALYLSAEFKNRWYGTVFNGGAIIFGTLNQAGVTDLLPANGGNLDITINSNSSPPGTWGETIVIGTEHISFTGRTGLGGSNYRLTGVTRAVDGTVAAAHANTTPFYGVPADGGHGVKMVVSCRASRVDVRADENFGSGLYVDSTCHANKGDVTISGSGWANPTAQPGAFIDGDSNVFDGSAYWEAGSAPLVHNETCAVEIGTNADGNTVMIAADDSYPTAFIFDGSAKSKNHVYDNQLKRLFVRQVVAAEGFAVTALDTTGLTNAQIDALFSTTPLNGTWLWDSVNAVARVRSGGAWVAAARFDDLALTSGEATMPRGDVSATTVAGTSGTLRLGYFTARKAETIANLRAVTGGTAAGATPTLVRLGLYTVAANGDLALVASTPNDTALLAAANTGYTKAVSASYAKVAERYALGILVVTAAAAPTYIGQVAVPAGELAAAPRLCAALGGQADLPATVAAGSLADTSQRPYLVALP